MRVEERGGTDGRANLPTTDSVSDSSTEADIGAEIDRRSAKSQEAYEVQLDLYEGRIKRGGVAVDLRTAIEAAGEMVLADFRVQVSTDIGDLEQSRRTLLEH